MFKRIYIVLFLAITLLSACVGQQEASSEKEIKKIKIGTIAPLTGDAAAYGEEVKKITDYVLPGINEKYKSAGYEFELIVEDGKCDGAASATALNKLADIDGVQYVFGGVCSSETLGIAPILEGRKIVAMTPASSNPDIEDKSNYLFSMSYSDAVVANGIYKELFTYKKVAILTEQTDYNTGLRKSVVAQLKSNNIEIVADEEFAKGATDLRNILQKIKSTNPDVIFLNPNVGITSETLVKQLAEMKDWNVAKVAAYGLMNEKVTAIDPEVLEGTVVVDVPTVNNLKFLQYRDEIVKAKGTLDNIGNYYTAATIDAINVLTQAIVEAQNNPEKVQMAISQKTYTGEIGTIYFGGKSFVQGIDFAKYVIKNGKPEQQ